MGGTELIALAISAAASAAAAKRASSQAKAQAQQQQQVANRNKQLAKIQANRDEKARREQAKSDAGSARAKMGATGVLSTGGSSQALLRGIRNDQNEDISQIRFGNKVGVQNSQMDAAQALHGAKVQKSDSNFNLASSLIQKGVSQYAKPEKPVD